MKNANKSACFYSTTSYTSRKTFLRKVKLVFVDSCTKSDWEFPEFVNSPMATTGITITPSLVVFSNLLPLNRYNLSDKRYGWKARSRSRQRRITKNVAKILVDLKPCTAGGASNLESCQADSTRYSKTREKVFARWSRRELHHHLLESALKSFSKGASIGSARYSREWSEYCEAIVAEKRWMKKIQMPKTRLKTSKPPVPPWL